MTNIPMGEGITSLMITQDKDHNAPPPIPSLEGLSVPAEELKEVLNPLIQNLSRQLYFDNITDHVLERKPWKMELGKRSPSAQEYYKRTNLLSANALGLMILPILQLANKRELSASQKDQLNDLASNTNTNAKELTGKILTIEASRIELISQHGSKSTSLSIESQIGIALEADEIDSLNDLEKGKSYQTAQEIKVESLKIINEIVQILTPAEQRS